MPYHSETPTNSWSLGQWNYARWLITITTPPPTSGSRAQSKILPVGEKGTAMTVKLEFYMDCTKSSSMNNDVEYKWIKHSK